MQGVCHEMNKDKAKLIRLLTIVSISIIILLIVILISLWSKYIEEQKQIKSSAVLSIIKLVIINSNTNDVNETLSDIAEYIGGIPNRKIAIYDDEYNLRMVYPRDAESKFDIKQYPNLFNSLETSNTGSKIINIDNYNEEIFWDWIISDDGSRQLLVIYGMTFESINEFSFVFIVSYLLIIFILILVVLIYLNDKYDYFISISRLYELSMRCDE